MFSSLFAPISGFGRVEACRQEASDWGESTKKEERGDGSDLADEARAQHHRVGTHQNGDWGPPAHKRPRLQLETEAQVPGKLWFEQTKYWLMVNRNASSVLKATVSLSIKFDPWFGPLNQLVNSCNSSRVCIKSEAHGHTFCRRYLNNRHTLRFGILPLIFF